MGCVWCFTAKVGYSAKDFLFNCEFVKFLFRKCILAFMLYLLVDFVRDWPILTSSHLLVQSLKDRPYECLNVKKLHTTFVGRQELGVPKWIGWGWSGYWSTCKTGIFILKVFGHHKLWLQKLYLINHNLSNYQNVARCIKNTLRWLFSRFSFKSNFLIKRETKTSYRVDQSKLTFHWKRSW